VLVTTLYWTLLHDKGALRTIASPSHRAIVLANSMAYRSIRSLHHRPNPSYHYWPVPCVCVCGRT